MKTIALEYFFPEGKYTNIDDEGLERITNLTGGLKESRAVIREKYSDIEMRVAVHLNEPYYHVYVHGDNDESLKGSLSEIMKSCGTPDFVGGNYKLVDEVLAEYGKKTKRKPWGFFLGKHVLDA